MHVILRIKEPARELKSISAIKILRDRSGMTLLAAKRTIEALIIEMYWQSDEWDERLNENEILVELIDATTLQAMDEFRKIGIEAVLVGDDQR